MFTLGAEIVPYHDYSLDESLRELADMGLHAHQPLDVGPATRPSRQPR